MSPASTQAPNKGQITVPVLLNAKQYEALLALAKRKGISFSAQMREVIDYYLHEMGGE